MAKKAILWGMAAALVFGLMVVGCGDGGGGGGGKKLATPTGLSATAASASSVQLQWNAVSGADEYRLERRKGDSGSFSYVHGDPKTPSYTDTGLQASTTYYYRVAAYASDYSKDVSDYSSPVSVTTNGYPAPSAPTGVTATAVNGSSSSIKVTWNTVTPAESYTVNYKVYYKKGSTPSTATNLTEATVYAGTSNPTYETEYIVSGLDALTDYVFFVKATAYSNGVDSDYSSASYAKTNVAQPTNVQNSAVNTTTRRITWDAVPSATSYKVYYESVAAFTGISNFNNATFFQTVTTTTVDVTGLTIGGIGNVYWVYIVPVGATGEGTYASTAF